MCFTERACVCVCVCVILATIFETQNAVILDQLFDRCLTLFQINIVALYAYLIIHFYLTNPLLIPVCQCVLLYIEHTCRFYDLLPFSQFGRWDILISVP